MAGLDTALTESAKEAGVWSKTKDPAKNIGTNLTQLKNFMNSALYRVRQYYSAKKPF
jgi:hypothetical protein